MLAETGGKLARHGGCQQAAYAGGGSFEEFHLPSFFSCHCLIRNSINGK
jgi:hypothetical protein